MAKQTINRGITAGDKTGESLFAAFGKANDNFTELYETSVISQLVKPENVSAAANRAVLQAAISAAGTVCIDAPHGTVIDVDETLLVPSNTTILLSDGITLRKTGTTSTQVFSNANKDTGNVNIAIVGNATIDGNVNNVTGIVSNIRNWNAINMVNVDGLVISGLSRGLLTVQGAYKFLLFAGAVQNFRFSDLDFQSAGADPTPGRDGIHLAGLSRKGIIERCFGTTNDDFIAVNPRAIPLAPNECYAEAMGPIREVMIRDIYGRVRDRSGNVLALYGATYDDAAQTVFDGDYLEATPTSTKPAITGITQAAGIATATTDKPHRMEQGDIFKIGSSNPSGYNADFGFVIDVPTPTTFTYPVNEATGAYVSGAALTIYWHLDDITVENVHGNTYRSSVFNTKITPGADQVGGVMRGLRVRGISGAVDGPLSVSSDCSLWAWVSVALIDSSIEGLSTPENAWMRLIGGSNLAGKDPNRTIGNVRIGSATTKANYLVNQNTGQGPIQLPAGKYEGLEIDGFTFHWAYNSGGWRHGIYLAMEDGSDVTLSRCAVRGVKTGGIIAAVGQFSAGSVLRLNDCFGISACEALVDIKDGASVTGGTVILDGGHVPASSLGAVKVYGNAINVILTGGFTSLSSATPVQLLGTSANCTVKADESVRYASSALATMTGTGPYSITGLGAKINVADAKVNRVDGAMVYNTNAAAGTLGAAGLVVGQGTAAGSWHLLADPTLVH